MTVSLVACGARQKGSAAFTRVSLLPRGTSFVMGVDVARLKQSPFWSTLGAKLVAAGVRGSNQRRLTALAEKCDLDLVRDTRWMLFAFDGSGRFGHAVTIINGAWDRAKAERCIPILELERTKEHDTLDDRIAEYNSDYYVAWLGPDTIAIATDDDALPFLREIVDHRSSVMDNPAVARMLGQVDRGSTVWAAGVTTQERNPFEDVLEDADINDKGSKASGIAMWAVLGNELTAMGRAEFSSPGEAASAVARFQKRLGEMRDDVPYLDRATVAVAGNQLETRGHLDRATLDQVAARLGGEADRELAYSKTPEPAYPEPTPDEAAPAAEPPPPPPPAEPDPAELERARKQAEAEAAARAAAARAAEVDRVKDNEDKLRRASARTKTGNEFLKLAMFDKALEEFKAAYALVPQPQLLYNIAASYDGLKDRQNALDTYKRYLDAEPNGARAKVSAKRIAELTKELQQKSR